MRLSPKKIGLALGKISAEHPHLVKEAIPEIARMISKAGKTSKLSEVIKYFKSSYNKDTKTIDIKIISAHKDNSIDIKELGGFKAEIKHIIDPSLLGGVRIETENFAIDSSIKAKISKIKSIALK